MELCGTAEEVEKMLRQEADLTYTPMMGTFELLPLCNMSCKMCYVRQTREEMELQGRMLTCDEWLRIAEEACDKGLLYLLLTGGEPLLYPDFQRLYKGVSQMGVILEINTNGTLIDEKMADFLDENGVRKLNITLYGKDNVTYAKLCNNPDGFTQVMRAARLLKERNILFRFNCSLTPDNVDQLPELQKIADSLGVDLAAEEYMFPAVRRGKNARNQYRLTAEQAVREKIYTYRAYNAQEAREKLADLERPPRLKGLSGFSCHAGHCAFSVNWMGEVLPCGLLSAPKISALEYSFDKCWNYIVDACKKLPECQKCMECDKQNVCQVCPAMCYAEAGSTAGCPDYVCQMTEHMITELTKIIENDAAVGKML